MHVLLIHPSQNKDGINILYGELGSIEHPPIGLAMLGAVLLEAGFEVDLIDMDAEHLTAEQIIQTIQIS